MKDKFKDQLPTINFVKGSVITISGRSYYADPRSKYDELLKEIEEHKAGPKKIEIVVDLEMFNTPSAKKLLEVFKSLESEESKVIWMYEEDDEDMLEAGQDYESIVKLPFEFVAKPV